jgi:beta-1,4-mannosyl-glycoprotein beta-1,4-N-acetylglucosaminyltransferase
MVLEEAQQYALCLNMIVKDESHIIKDTLTKLLQKIKFDYWVISDTGSTDKTKEIITDFFKEVGIPGELYEDEWVDFSHNRNKALEYAFGKSKYLLIFDADDEICGDFVLPELVKDYYQFQFGSYTRYTRTQIVNNSKRWKYVGVLHECIVSNDDRIDGASMEVIKGPYHAVSGRSGNRNLDSNKYLKDAIILEKAYYNAVDAKDDIYNRYGFYCANSYYDCEKYEHAITWYKKTLENGGWAQEKYVSCLNLYKCYEKMNNKESGFFYLVKSAEYDRERAECYYELVKNYSGSGLHDVAYGYYGVLRDFYNNSYLKNGLNNKLFLDESVSEFYLPYYVIIVSEKMRDYDTGIQMYRIIFTKKYKIFDKWFIGNLMYNLQFFTEHVKEEDKTAFYSLFQEYVDFLVANNYPLFDETIKIYEKYGIKKREASIANDDECLTSKKILIYTGFMDYLWNDTYVSNNAIGGAEKAVAYLARNLPKEYEIIISGDVADEVVGNVRYVNRFKLQALLDVEKFHTIIVSRYVSFFLLFPRFSCHQLYLSAHDIGFLNNLNDVPVHTIIEENNKYIKGVICLTTWHKLNTIQTHACLKDKVFIINNGILVAGATSNKKLSHNKIKNKFAWTSCSNRGLDVMLKMWGKILEVMPDATLDISSYDAFPNPSRNNDEEIQMIINRHSDSVKHHGKLNNLQLHDLISKAEYWLYTTTFCETSCITALEMLMHEVVCLYYPLAGLTDTIGEYGIQVTSGTEIESIMNLSEAKKVEMRINGKKYAVSCSWENRAKEWAGVLGLNNQCVVNAQVTSDDDIYNINKIDNDINLMFEYGISNNTDKVVHHEYHKIYDNILQPFHKAYGGLVEIGVGNGLSLSIWMSMFENSHIYGIEKEISNISININNDKVTILEADQSNIDDLKKIKSMLMNKNIFFINDDGSHIPEHQILTFNMLFPILVEGGIYIIEDIETSYWTKGSCYDYKTEYGYKHCKSIIEIFKDSIDIMNREFISDKKQLSNKILHHNYIESVLFARNCIIIKKSYNADREYRFKQFIEVETTSKDINAEVKINLNKKEWVFFCSVFYEKKMIQQYIDGLNNLYADAEYYIHLSSDKEAIMKSKPEKVTIVYEVFDSSIFNALPTSKFSFLNTEPLTIPYRLDNIKLIFELYKKHVDSFNYYDYSESNLRLLNDKCIGVGVDKDYLPYKCSSEELLILQGLNKNTKKEYDFGILKTLGKEVSPRRKKIVDFLKSCNFSVNIIEGWNYNDRDFELAKCKIILNIHGNLNNDVSTIFEHIRCDRLLESGFNILSETSYDLSPEFIQNYPNLVLIEYEDFFDIGIMVDCYNNPLMSKEHNKYVLDILNNCYNKIDIPLVHISFMEKLSLEFNPNRMVIYDIGSSVLHWTQHANVLWKDSAVYLFDAMTEMKLFYDEYNKKKNTTFEYNVGVLCDEDYKRISFYQNNELSGGNSYYKEIGHPDSHKIFTENHIKHKLGMKLETVVKNKKIPLPDLIKIDVQGAELDILKGSMKIINNAKFLIVELQHVEYNEGAPMCNKTRDFLIENGWEVYAEKFSNNGPDADWCFINNNKKNNKMIVDCFIFYNELDMLTYRLNILDKVVDYFVLVESTHTHIGKEKPLFYNENKHLFAKFNHKIIHIVVDDFPHKYPNINIEKQEQWINERFQRDCISRGIDKLNLTGEDIIIISDLDEIPNPTVLEKVKNNNIVVGINILDMDLYYYNLNSKMGIKWYASKILTFEKYKELNTGCDKIRFYDCPIINNAGWHLSYFGNEKFIKNKLENFTHQEFNMTEFTDEKRIEERIKNGKDLFDRHIKIENIPVEDNDNLPPEYDIYLKNYYNICHEDEKVEVKLNLNKKEMDLNKFNNGSGIFIQIGAGAGDLDERANCRDGFTELVKKLPRQSIKKIILVEPNPLNIPLLKECWKDYPESIIYEIGIVPKNYQDNTIDLYYCPLDAPHYQVASINKSHVQKHYGDNCEIEKFIIPVKQLETFINEITREEIDLLALDIEGIDAEILLDIDFNNLKLKYLSFEHLHLGEYKDNVLNHLKNNNYEFVGSGVDHNGYDYLYINGHYL